jgi:hypothetical protein
MNLQQNTSDGFQCAGFTTCGKVLFVIPSEARDLLFFSASKKQQIPQANPAFRNDMARVFPQPVQPVGFERCGSKKVHRQSACATTTHNSISAKNHVSH